MAIPIPARTAGPRSRQLPGGRPLGAQVYEQLRDLIVDGELAPGAPLVQEQLAEQLGVSRTPLREALNRLVHEGLADWVAGSGFVVRDLSDADVSDVYQVRQTLELMALRLAGGGHDRVALAVLESLVDDMVRTDPADAGAQFELNRQFHRALIEPCGNPVLLRLIEQLWDNPVNRRITRSYLQHDAGNVDTMVAEHRALLAAAAQRDTDRLVELAAAHLRAGYGDVLSDTAGG